MKCCPRSQPSPKEPWFPLIWCPQSPIPGLSIPCYLSISSSFSCKIPSESKPRKRLWAMSQVWPGPLHQQGTLSMRSGFGSFLPPAPNTATGLSPQSPPNQNTLSVPHQARQVRAGIKIALCVLAAICRPCRVRNTALNSSTVLASRSRAQLCVASHGNYTRRMVTGYPSLQPVFFGDDI